MLVIRLYIAALTIIVCVLLISTRDIGLLEATVLTCPILFLIFDIKAELHELKFLSKALERVVSSE
ncbi:MAG: hypothetical protein C5B55_14825 [Blastocatellia bacterium]|nr:MAG: hypothetical protein C5B55_14825 [Blastocatellia bacterium]